MGRMGNGSFLEEGHRKSRRLWRIDQLAPPSLRPRLCSSTRAENAVVIVGVGVVIVGVADMASKTLYEPATRYLHVSFLVEGKVYLWGGTTQGLVSGFKDDIIKLANCIEQFDPYLEVWNQLNTVGIPHPGLECAACASSGEHVYMYGGFKDKYEGVLSCLNVKTLTWSRLSPEGETAGGPMRKVMCGMMHFNHDKLAVIGGYGFPTGPTQPGSSFILNTKFTDGRGWTNEIHVFDLSQGSRMVIPFNERYGPMKEQPGHFDTQYIIIYKLN